MDYELMDLYDSNRNKTGNVVKRYKGKRVDVPSGFYINIVIIFILNSRGEFLIQKTSKEKKGLFATTGGHSKIGDDSNKTVEREVLEEIGLDISNLDYKLFKTYKTDNCFFDVYYLYHDIDISSLVYQKDEVDYCEWMSIDDIKTHIGNNQFRKSNILAFNDFIVYNIKNVINNNLLIINNNLDRCLIKVTDDDIARVNDLLLTDDYDLLKQCSDEMDDIINGILISIDNELKELLNLGHVDDYDLRVSVMNKIMSISDSIKYENMNNSYFMSMIKKIYNNIDGDKL